MIKIEKIQQDINNLPQEAQLLLIDFIELLKKRYAPLNIDNIDSTVSGNIIIDEPFVGMWQDREDMKDSSQWVRQVRKQEWMS